MLGIIGAMDVEVNSIKSELENVEIKNIAAMDFYHRSKHPLPHHDRQGEHDKSGADL